MLPLASRHSPPSELTAQSIGRRGQVEKRVPAVDGMRLAVCTIRACLAVCTSALPHEASVPDSVLPACRSAVTGRPKASPPAPDTQLELTS